MGETAENYIIHYSHKYCYYLLLMDKCMEFLCSPGLCGFPLGIRGSLPHSKNILVN